MSERYLVTGDMRLDRADERLWKGDAPVKLGGKALALVAALMARPKLLVSKDELFDAVWPGLAISESVLTTAVKEVRQALGDDARRPTIIETVHGRGYRFLLEVVETNELTPAAVEPETPHVDLARVRLAKWRAAAALLTLLIVLGLVVVWWLPRGAAAAQPTAQAQAAKK